MRAGADSASGGARANALDPRQRLVDVRLRDAKVCHHAHPCGAHHGYQDAARGDLAGVGNLLTDQVAHDFQAFADGRRQRGETEALLFIGFSGADVIAASFDDVASLDVRFSADIVSVTRDRDGRIIEGSPDRVIRVAEIWTFERDLKTPKSRWLLAATDADE